MSAPLNLSALPEDGNYAVTCYEYNELGQLVKETDALGQSTVYVNDLAGQVKQKTDRNGNTTSYTYNVRGDLLTQSVTANGETLTLQNTYSKAGLLKQTSDNEGTTSYTYDALGQLTEEEKGNIINTYEYDIYGNRTAYTLTNAGAQVLQNSYTYDNLNRLTGVVNGTETTAYSYDGNGNVLYEQSGTMRYVYYSYNAAGLLTEKENVAGVTELTTDYAYNLDGNIRQETDTETGTTSYTYDGMGRLTSETVGDVTTSYSYDAYSNRASKTVGSGEDAAVTNYTYDANNRLLRENETANGVQVSSIYTYDANGNQLAKAVHSTSGTASQDAQTHLGAPAMANAEVVLNRYDALNRLISTERSINGETVKASYTYNAAGIRTSKTVNGVMTQHLLDGVNVAADVTNGTTTSFVRGLGLISMNANGTKSYYVTDGHGDVRVLTDASGVVTKRYEYDAFGNEVDESSTDPNPFRYCGEYFDAETGSVYLRARYYDSRVGRFGAEDTHWGPHNMIYGENGKPSLSAILQSANLYAYCGYNPINRVDISGFEWGYIRDFANDLSMLYGNPEYIFGYGGVRVQVGSGYRTPKSGMFYFDGYAEVKKPGSRDFNTIKIAENIDGRLYMDRRDFYRTMGINYISGTITFTVTEEGNLIQGIITGGIVGTYMGNWSGGIVSGLIGYAYQRAPGEYKVETTTVYVYDAQGRFYDTITTYEVFWKAPGYDSYATAPVEVKTTYLRTDRLFE